MRIKLDQYEVMQAIEEYLKNMGCNFNFAFDSTYTELFAHVTEDVRQHKKNKNGKVVKNEHGHPEWETVGQETKSLHIKEFDEIEIYVEC
tara:strand:- start:217 stop:486 length:270 start_codon:yes stop_codon:yes gene_type:complete